MQVSIKRLDPDAEIPVYATLGAACFDLAAIEGGVVSPGVATSFRTGLAFEIPDDHVMLVFSRSGHGFKNGIRLANGTGIIDSDYRGEVMVKLTGDAGGQTLKVLPGDRIAQAMIVPVPSVRFVEYELSPTERGAGGFGSTGK